MGAVRSRLRRWHIWLGWIVGIPFLRVDRQRPADGVEADRGGPRQPPDGASRRRCAWRCALVPPALAGVPLQVADPRTARWRTALGDRPARRHDPPRRSRDRRAAAALVGGRRGARSDGALHRARRTVRSVTPHRSPTHRRSSSAGRSPRGRWRWTTAPISTSMPARARSSPGAPAGGASTTSCGACTSWTRRGARTRHNPWVVGFGIAALRDGAACPHAAAADDQTEPETRTPAQRQTSSV